MTEDEIRARYEQADYEEDENDEENEYYEVNCLILYQYMAILKFI